MRTNDTSSPGRSGLGVCSLALLTVLGAALMVYPLQADSLTGTLSQQVLTNVGEVLEARAGTYGELFPGGTQLPPSRSVLVLDIQPQDGDGGRLLVPSTDDDRVEIEPFAIFESAEDAADETLLLGWQSRVADGSARQIRFVSVRRGSGGLEWSEIFTVRNAVGDPLVLHASPEVAITRQIFDQELQDQTYNARHTLVHLLWQGGPSGHHPMYSSIVWVDGLYVGFNPVFNLADFLTPQEVGGIQAPPPALPANLENTTALQVGSGGQSLELSFADVTTGRLGHVVIDAVPLAYGVLGDLVRDEMFTHADSYDPDHMQTFVDKFRAGVVIIGREFKYHPAVVEYVSSRVGTWLLDQGGNYGFEEFVGLGEDARDMTIGLTHSVYTKEVADPANPGSTLVELDLSEVLGGGTAADQPGQLLDFRVTADLEAPAIGEGATAILASPDGQRLTVTWQAEDSDRMHYVESSDNGSWAPVQSLQLREGLSREDALRLLASKLR